MGDPVEQLLVAKN